MKKQGVLALTFDNKTDYDKIREDDRFDIIEIKDFQPGKSLTLIAQHSDGSIDNIVVNQSYNQNQIEWFKSGSALNSLAKAEMHVK